MGLRAAWTASLVAAIGLRLWNALAGPMLYGYDGWAHVAYVLFLDQYQAIPYADQGWCARTPLRWTGLAAWRNQDTALRGTGGGSRKARREKAADMKAADGGMEGHTLGSRPRIKT